MSTITIDGIDPGDELRAEAINANVSAIAAIPEVRDKLIGLQRGYLEHSSVVMEGRDIGSVVFPDTPYKIYVDAAEARPRRAPSATWAKWIPSPNATPPTANASPRR